MPSTGFPLLTLPELIIRQILLKFDIYSFFDFSLLTEEAKHLAKSVNIYRKPLNFQVKFDDSVISLVISFKNSCLHIKSTSPSLRRHRPFIRRRQLSNTVSFYGYFEREDGRTPCLVTLWDNPVVGIIHLADYLTELFNFPVEEFQVIKTENGIDEVYPYAAFIPLIFNWICRLPLRKLIINNVPATEGQFRYLITNCKSSDYSLFNFHNQYIDFSPNLSESIGPNVAIENGTWLKMRHLHDTSIDTIYANAPSIKLSFVKTFLLKWLNEDFLKPRQMTLQLRWQPIVRWLRELNFRQMDNTAFPFNGYDHQNCRKQLMILRGGWQIQRETDGAVARIYLDSMRPYYLNFQFFVWTQEEYEGLLR